jgi:thiamine biosynthesis lipoprotein
MNRRDFLGPLAQALETRERVSAPPDAALLRASRRAMATIFEVILSCGTSNGLVAAEAALDEIDQVEDQLTVYREHSEISDLNRRAADEPVIVEARMFDLLCLCERLTRETEGAFDVSVGPLIKAWGFYRRAGRVPSDEERAEVMTRVGMSHVALDPENHTVAYRRPGIEINLGSIGKGYALDRIVGLLRGEWGIASGLVHGGRSSIFAMGDEPGRRGWRVGIADPRYPKRRLAIVRLRNQALGTSAATFQHLQHQGRRLGHILDPRSGWPAEGMLGTSVIAPTAAEADALATAFFILGVDKARAYCEAHPGTGACLIPDSAERRPVIVGIPPADIETM